MANSVHVHEIWFYRRCVVAVVLTQPVWPVIPIVNTRLCRDGVQMEGNGRFFCGSLVIVVLEAVHHKVHIRNESIHFSWERWRCSLFA